MLQFSHHLLRTVSCKYRQQFVCLRNFLSNHTMEVSGNEIVVVLLLFSEVRRWDDRLRLRSSTWFNKIARNSTDDMRFTSLSISKIVSAISSICSTRLTWIGTATAGSNRNGCKYQLLMRVDRGGYSCWKAKTRLIFFFTIKITENNHKSWTAIILTIYDLWLFPVISTVKKKSIRRFLARFQHTAGYVHSFPNISPKSSDFLQ